MQVVGVITVGIYSSFSELEEWCVPPRDPNRGSIVTVPVGSATSKIPERASRMERINNWVAAVLSAAGGELQGLNSRNAAHVKGTIRRLHVCYKDCAEAQRARSARRLG